MSLSSPSSLPTDCHNLSDDDWNDIQLSHEYRLHLQTKPSQSSFRVLALVFYESIEDNEEDGTELPTKSAVSTTLPFVWIPRYTTETTNSNDDRNNDEDPQQQQRKRPRRGRHQRTYVVGTNDEPGFIGGAICAERAAMVQLRFAPPHKITKIVICTDSADPISPGMLCREFIAGHGGQGDGGGRHRRRYHQEISWDLPVISTGSYCRRCQKQDEGLFVPMPSTPSSSSSFQCSTSICNSSDGDKTALKDPGDEIGFTHHDIPVLQTTIRELYPHPSPYTRLTAKESVELGKKFHNYYYSSHQSQKQEERSEKARRRQDDNTAMGRRLLQMAMNEAQKQRQRKHGDVGGFDPSSDDDSDDIHPIYFGAAVEFQNGSIVTSYQLSALEYGCTLDAVSQLATQIDKMASATTNNGDGGEGTHDRNLPICLVQVDQYGIAHAPFAPARAFLTEHGYGSCDVLLHDTGHSRTNEVTPFTNYDDVEQWKLIQVNASSLAPNSPSWCNGTKPMKN